MTEMILLVLGVLYLAVGIRTVIDPGFIGDIMADFNNSPGLTYLTGTIVVIMCLPLLWYHNEWGTARQGVASFILWAGLIKGLSFLAFPRFLFGVWEVMFPKGKIARIIGIVVMSLGAALIWWALKA